jgi:E1A-binding protein p400
VIYILCIFYKIIQKLNGLVYTIFTLNILTARKQKQRKEEQPRVPRSLFDRPTSALLKLRREAKLKQGLLKPFRPVPQMVNKPPDPTPDHPEWLIHEDWALLQVITEYFLL